MDGGVAMFYDCRLCSGALSRDPEVMRYGGHHRILQGTTLPMCCKRAEGAELRCGKPGCPMRFVVSSGFVYAIDPEGPLEFAHRGPDHTVRHRPRYHDYWCDLIPNGMEHNFMQQEYHKAQRLLQAKVNKVNACVIAFTAGIERFLGLLKLFGVGMSLKREPELSIQVPTIRFTANVSHPESVFDALGRPCDEARHLKDSAVREVRTFCRKLQFLRVLVQISRQKIPRHCLTTILMFLGQEGYVPRCGDCILYELEKVDLPQTSPKVEIIEESDVIMPVDHVEPAAMRQPELAAMQAEHDWADQLVVNIQQGHVSEQEHPASEEAVYLLHYNRHSEKFRASPHTHSELLASCRSALEQAGFEWLQASGAKVFVHPWQFDMAMAAVSGQKIELRPFHVIVSASLEYYVEAALSDLPCRDGARVKRRQVLETKGGHTGEETCGENEAATRAGAHPDEGVEEATMVFTEDRTFLCFVPRLRNPNSVTQSTTEAHGGLNPRRLAAVSLASVSE